MELVRNSTSALLLHSRKFCVYECLDFISVLYVYQAAGSYIYTTNLFMCVVHLCSVMPSFDQSGFEVDVMGMENGSQVFLSGGEPFISPTAKEGTNGQTSLTISNYVTSKFLGKGGFGNVYLGKHNVTGKEVALKLMSMEVFLPTCDELRFVRCVFTHRFFSYLLTCIYIYIYILFSHICILFHERRTWITLKMWRGFRQKFRL